MRKLVMGVVAACVLGIAGEASAQQQPAAAPEAVPEKMPFDIPYGSEINLDRANRLIDAAKAEARKHNWMMAIAVVGPSGDLVAFQRMDGTQFASVGIAQDKAVAAARFRRPTKVFADAMAAGHVEILSLRGVVVFAGGFPLIEGGRIIGAIGCSGGVSAQDAATCQAGAELVK
ncbi:MAG TPA: heme-binding protein [Stellaceae bacterium]|nr:heme-binding protein [Stellaceae bacterium]